MKMFGMGREKERPKVDERVTPPELNTAAVQELASTVELLCEVLSDHMQQDHPTECDPIAVDALKQAKVKAVQFTPTYEATEHE